MANYQIFLLLGSVMAAYLLVCYLDKRFGMKLVDWCNGEVDNPFVEKKQDVISEPTTLTETDQIQNLKERIAVLEKVVTEPAYELNKKINALYN